MGCPARKVCNVFSGSALMKDETLVASILETVVNAVDIPVTLKIRTGWNKQNKNSVKIAQIAENLGIQMLTVHGRTRACGFSGDAEYITIREVKAHVSIPVIANGDITTPEKAEEVLSVSGTDGLMLGRAALGNPWIFNEINHFLNTGTHLSRPRVEEIQQVMLQHLSGLYELYGEYTGVRVARKHVGWYCKHLQSGEVLRSRVNKTDTVRSQLLVIEDYFSSIKNGEALAA
jgi:tRNA-dihydrouridine synthase B